MFDIVRYCQNFIGPEAEFAKIGLHVTYRVV